jgi:hypothetical protein
MKKIRRICEVNLTTSTIKNATQIKKEELIIIYKPGTYLLVAAAQLQHRVRFQQGPEPAFLREIYCSRQQEMK